MEIRKTLRYCLARVDVATGRARRGFAAKRPRVIDPLISEGDAMAKMAS